MRPFPLALLLSGACLTELPEDFPDPAEAGRYRCAGDADCLAGYVCTGGFCAVAQALPAAVVGLVATPGNGGVDLSWMPAAGAMRYTVERSNAAGGPYDVV